MDKSEKKKVYAFDAAGKYLGERLLDWTDRSPISGRWQIPAGCTETVVNEAKEGYSRIFDGKAWKYVKEEEKKAEAVKPSKPTAEEKKAMAIAKLDAEYDESKKELALTYVDALMVDDIETQESLKEDLLKLNDNFDTKMTELEAE